jgi:hypothetical protein
VGNCAGRTSGRREISRAPQEGHGSGGNLKLEGWDCISAHPPEAPLLGHCDKQDGSSSSFEVRQVTE